VLFVVALLDVMEPFVFRMADPGYFSWQLAGRLFSPSVPVALPSGFTRCLSKTCCRLGKCPWATNRR